MKKHIVTCVKCGRQFDANEGGAYYPESRRYVCKHCVDKQKDIQKEQAKARKAAEREAEADERERVPGNCSVLHFVFDDTTDTFKLVEIFTQEDYARELGLEPLVAAAGPQRG